MDARLHYCMYLHIDPIPLAPEGFEFPLTTYEHGSDRNLNYRNYIYWLKENRVAGRGNRCPFSNDLLMSRQDGGTCDCEREWGKFLIHVVLALPR